MNEYQTLAAKLVQPLSSWFARSDLTRDLGRGTAMPVSADLPGGLLTDDRFFRTDLDWLCAYDGTRWLTVHEYGAELTTLGLYTQPYTGGAVSLLVTVPRVSHAVYSTHARVFLSVQTTNNITNFWSLSLKADASVLWSFSTSAIAAGTNSFFQTALASQNGPNLFTIDVSKTGAPGSLVIHGTLFYRFVVT